MKYKTPASIILGSDLAIAQEGPAEQCKSDCCPSTADVSGNELCNRVWEVWHQHAQELRRFLQQRTREQMLTDDLLSDVMLKVYKNCEKLPNIKDMRAWLTRVAKNTLMDHYRKPVTKALPATDVMEALANDDLLPEQRMAACLAEMLRLLPYADRQPLQWADLEGLPQEEVARRLGLSLSGAKSRIQRARVKLKQQIDDCCQVEVNTHGRVTDYYAKKKC